MLETKFVRDNSGKGHHVYTGLKKGDKVEAIVNQRGMCDSGNIHLLFDGSILTKGKVMLLPTCRTGDLQKCL